MQKSRAAYYYILSISLLPLPFLFVSVLSAVILSAAAVLYALWWTLYFRRLSYSIIEDVLIIKSGILLKKQRRLPLQNIQWVMRVKLPFCRSFALSVLHTAGSRAVIFADFSTES